MMLLYGFSRRHESFGSDTNELFAALLLGIQQPEPFIDPEIIEELLESFERRHIFS